MCADDQWLSGASARDTVGIHFTWKNVPEILDLLPHIDDAFDHPKKRAAVEQFILALGRLEGRVGKARDAAADRAAYARSLPILEVVGGRGANAQFHEMNGHRDIKPGSNLTSKPNARPIPRFIAR
jgi:hypothetical protein